MTGPGRYGERSDVRRFVDEVVETDGYPRSALLRAFRDARYRPAIVAAMDRPLIAPPKWYQYAPRFLNAGRIGGGIEFWRTNEAPLARAASEFGVPAEIVVAILGIETYYGRNTGDYRVLDALSTLAFDYPRRGSYFRGQLREFFLFIREQALSPLAPLGSYAGAMGLPQFMPGSARRYAVDYDSDGRIDLWRSAADSIGSVANYLARHDWLRGQPVWSQATVTGPARDAALARLDGGISERRPLDAWYADGVTADAVDTGAGVTANAVDTGADITARATAAARAQPVGLLLLEEDPQSTPPPAPGAEPASLWIVFPNYYAITRYNRSRLYAAAVTRLAEALRAAHDVLRG